MITARKCLSTLGLLLASVSLTANAGATTHTYFVVLDGSKENPPVVSAATGLATVTLDDVSGVITVSGTYAGMTGATNNAHIHGNNTGSECTNSGVMFGLTHTGGSSGSVSGSTTFTPAQVQFVLDGKTYLNFHSTGLPGGEIRGQISNGTYFCDSCDSALSLCPCANAGNNDSGCDNATSTGGVKLIASIYAPDGGGGGTYTLQGSGFPPMGAPTAIVIRSMSEAAPPVVFGDGLRCIGLNGLVRFGATAAVGGISTHTLTHGAGGGTFKYQLWYRNTPITFCDAAAAFNLSNGLSLDW